MQLSICMPSNRDAEASRRAIESALAYCEARDAMLILSDNSGDAGKQALWENRSPHLRYVVPDDTDALNNFMNALRMAETPFVMPMGDDDELLFDPAIPAFDFAGLPDDHVGVHPIGQLWTKTFGVVRIKDFAIDAETPADRILQYSQRAAGDNSAFYSMFRRATYMDLVEMHVRHHPTKGGYCDWAQVAALAAYGKMARDPGTTFRYNYTGWQKQADMDSNTDRLYAAAGLPADAPKYAALLVYLDLFVYVSSRKAPLSEQQFANAIGLLSGGVLEAFLVTVRKAPDEYSEVTRYLVELIEQEQDAMGRFHLALVMANQIADGLKDRYIRYYQAALNF